jgi:hypothetical protein
MTEHTNTVDTTTTTDAIEAAIAEIPIRRLDDAHLAWFIAESECERALRAWGAGSGDDADTAFCSYLAALDREESAALHLERLWRATEPAALTLVQRMQDVVH